VQTESLAAVLAEASPSTMGRRSRPAANVPGEEFTLYKASRSDGAAGWGPRYIRMRFAQALRGLDVGAPIEFVA